MSMSANLDSHDHSWANAVAPKAHAADPKTAALKATGEKRPETTLYVNGKEVGAYLKLNWIDHTKDFIASVFGFKKIFVVKLGDKDHTVGAPVYLKVSDIAKELGVTSAGVRDLFKEEDLKVAITSKVASTILGSSAVAPQANASSEAIDAEIKEIDFLLQDLDQSASPIQKTAEEVKQAADTVMQPKLQTAKEELTFLWELNTLVPTIQDGQGLNAKEKADILTLGRTVGFEKVMELLKTFPGDLKIKNDPRTTTPFIDPRLRMLRTLILAGEQLNKRNAIAGEPAKFQQIHKVKNQTFSFIIDANNRVYVTTDLLGKGAYKKVSRTIELSTLDEYVRPVVVGDGAIDKTKEEIHLLKRLYDNKIPNLVLPYKFSFTTSTKLNEAQLVMLQVKYDGDGTKIPKNYLRQGIKALSDCAKGLAGMHSAGLVHSDFKPANFLIQGDPYSTKLIEARVADFGGATKNGTEVLIHTSRYAPPEILLHGRTKVTDKWDSFALGVSLFEIIFKNSTPVPSTLRQINAHAGFGRQSATIMDSELEKLRSTGSKLVPQQQIKNAVLDVMIGLLKGDPASRMSCADAAVELDKILTM